MSEKTGALIETARQELSEHRAALLNKICELCHYPYIARDQQALDEICERCPVADDLDGLRQREKGLVTAQLMAIVAEEMLGGKETI